MTFLIIISDCWTGANKQCLSIEKNIKELKYWCAPYQDAGTFGASSANNPWIQPGPSTLVMALQNYNISCRGADGNIALVRLVEYYSKIFTELDSMQGVAPLFKKNQVATI